VTELTDEVIEIVLGDVDVSPRGDVGPTNLGGLTQGGELRGIFRLWYSRSRRPSRRTSLAF
jgi:hypothetical protein